MSDTVAAAAPLLAQKQLVELLGLVKDADSVELKLSVDASQQRSAVEALGLDPLEAQVRLVHFFDTPDLALERAASWCAPGACRARATTRWSSSVRSGRPDLPKRLRRHPELRRRGRRHDDRLRLLGVVQGRSRRTPIRESRERGAPLRKLFTKEQRAFYAEHAPEGIELDDLVRARPDLRAQDEGHAAGVRAQARRRALAVSRRRRGSWRSRRSARRPRRSRSLPRRARSSASAASRPPRTSRRRRARRCRSSPDQLKEASDAV